MLFGSSPTPLDFDRITDRIVVGSCPFTPADLDRLKQECGVTAVFSLQTDADRTSRRIDQRALDTRCRALGLAQGGVAVRDFDSEDLRRQLVDCVAALERLLSAGHNVYVHCNSGIGRSPSVVLAYLHWVEGWPWDRAVDHVRQCRACCPNQEVIRAARDDWQRRAAANPGEAESGDGD